MRHGRVVGGNRETRQSSHRRAQLDGIQNMIRETAIDKLTFWDCQESDRDHAILVCSSGTVIDVSN